MTRFIAVLFVTIVGIVSAIFLALSTSANPLFFAASLAITLIGAYQSIALFWDRFVPDKDSTQKKGQPLDVDDYLAGRIEEFSREEKWFVELAGETAIQTRFDLYGADFGGEAREKPVETFDDIRLAAQKFDQFVIIGDPGAGKSTSLRKIATDAVRDSQTKQSNLLPLWIPLGFSENPVDAHELLRYWWHEHYRQTKDIDGYLNNNLLWLFLDGLNEMPEKNGSRKERAEKIRAFLKAHPNLRAVITCRVNDYKKSSPLPSSPDDIEKKLPPDDGLNLDLPVVRVQPLDDGRIQAFIQRRLSDLTLWSEIEKSDALQRMAANPYNLVMLIEIYELEKGQLPSDLNELYTMYFKGKYRKYKKDGKFLHLSLEDLEKKLQHLAFRMIADGKGTAADIQWAQRQIGRKTLKEAIDLGVVVQDKETIRFYHQSLHGYFALPGLRIALQQKKVEQRVSFIRQIGDLGEAAAPAVSALIEALRDQDADVRRAAAEALGWIGAPAVPALSEALRDQDKDVRGAAVWALRGIGAPAVPALSAALRDQDWRVRFEAARVLGQMGEVAAPAVPVLIEILRDQDVFVRSTAAGALWNISQNPVGIPILIQALRDQDRYGRSAAARALGQMGDATAVPSLIEVLGDQDRYGRSAAARALGRIGDATAVPALREALRDQNWDVRREAANALGRIGEAAAPAVPALIEALRDESEYVRSEAAEALGEIGEAAVPALREALRDQNWYVRREAAEALGLIGDPSAVPALIEALGDQDWDVRREAAEALGLIGDPSAVPALIEALGDQDWDVRREAAEALGRIGAPAVPALIEALRDQDAFVGWRAAKALENINTPEAQEALRRYRAGEL
jgi:HEAT repeat protein